MRRGALSGLVLALAGLVLALAVVPTGCAPPAPSEREPPQVAIEPTPPESERAGPERAGPERAGPAPSATGEPSVANESKDAPPAEPSPAGDDRSTPPPPSATAAASAAAPPSPKRAARDAFREGMRAYRDGDHEKALQHFEQAYAHMPMTEVLHNLAMAAFRAGQKRKACQYYVRSRKRGNPEIAELTKACATRP